MNPQEVKVAQYKKVIVEYFLKSIMDYPVSDKPGEVDVQKWLASGDVLLSTLVATLPEDKEAILLAAERAKEIVKKALDKVMFR